MSLLTELCHLAADVPDVLLKLLLVKAGFDITYLLQGFDCIMNRQEPCRKTRQIVTTLNPFKGIFLSGDCCQ